MRKMFLVSMMAILLSLVGCQKEQEFPAPKVTVTPDVAGETSLSFKITPSEAEKCAYLCVEAVEAVPTVDAVLESGVTVATEAGVQTVENLKPATRYYIVAAVEAHDMKAMSRTIAMTTAEPIDPQAEPKATVALQEKSATVISFKIVPENAVRCSYVCVEDGEKVPSAQDIIKNGVRVLPNAESVNRVDGLMEGTPYVVVAAVQNGEKYSTAELKVETALGEELVFVPEEGKGHKILGNNYFVRLINGEDVLSLDFFAEKSEVLPAGTYVLSSAKEEFAIWTTSSKFGKEGGYRTFTDGEVNVELEGETYTLSFYLIMDDATVLTGSYTGELEGMFVEFPEYVRPGQMKFTGAKAKHFYKEALLTFYCEDGEHNLILDVFFPKMNSKKCLPLGEFPLLNQGYVPGSYVSTIASNLKDLNSGAEDNLVPEQGLVVIDVEDGDYVISFKDLYTVSGVMIDDVYRGQIDNLEIPKELVQRTATSAEYIEVENRKDGEFFIEMTDADASFKLALDLFGAKEDQLLQAGTYKYGDGAATFGKNSYVSIDGAEVSFTEGTAVVAVEEKVYTLTFDGVGSDDRHYVIDYTGEIKNMPEPKLEEVVMDFLSFSGYLAEDGVFALNAFNFDVDNSFEMMMYLVGNLEDTYIQPGQYTFSNDPAPFTFTADSYISFYSPYETIAMLEGSKVDIALEGETYTLTFDIIGSSRGVTKNYKGVYTGKIDGMKIGGDDAGVNYDLNMAVYAGEGLSSGYSYIAFLDVDQTCEIYIEYKVKSGETLPAGTYSQADGTMGYGSFISYYAGGKVDLFKLTSEVSIDADGNYTLTFSGVGNDDVKYSGEFHGAIISMM